MYTKGEWKAYKSRPHDPDSWEWEVSAGDIVVASRLNEANAERIVKAVNCHDDLYEALKEAWVYLAPKCHEAKVKTICDKAGEALARAEGK